MLILGYFTIGAAYFSMLYLQCRMRWNVCRGVLVLSHKGTKAGWSAESGINNGYRLTLLGGTLNSDKGHHSRSQLQHLCSAGIHRLASYTTSCAEMWRQNDKGQPAPPHSQTAAEQGRQAACAQRGGGGHSGCDDSPNSHTIG